MRRTLAGLVVAIGCLSVASSASASTFLQFNELLFTHPFQVTTNGTTSSISAVNVPVNVTFDSSFCLLAGCGGATNGTYALNLTANSTTTAVDAAGNITQHFDGTISFTSPGINLLTVSFSDVFTGPTGGSSNIAIGAAQPPDTFTGSSTVFDPLKLGIPRGFALSFSNFSPALNTNGTTINAATADATGTFDATPGPVVPEPASMLLLGTGLVGIGNAVRRRRAAARA